MIIVDQILQWARNEGYTAVYGSPEQVNEMLTSVPFANSKDGTVVIMHLIADSETYNGHDRATLAVYFASLCDFDFDGEALLPEQERLKDIGKDLLNYIRTGNVLSYADPRWQYGYDDYAENVAWVCLRVTLTALAADCVPLPMPEPPAPTEDFAAPDGLIEAYSEIAGFPEWGKICEMAEWEREEDWQGVTVNNIIFMFLARQRAEGFDLRVTINGTYADGWEYIDITDEAVQAIPLLAPYLGWVMVLGRIRFEDVPVSPGDTCNVSVTYQGEEVLGCSGEIPPAPGSKILYFEAKAANSTVSMVSTLATEPNLEYSEDGETWQEWQHTTAGGTHTFDTLTLANVGDKVYFRGTNAAMSDTANSQFSTFLPTGNVKVGGSVQSLVDGTGDSTTAIEMCRLFYRAEALTEVESGLLPATTLTDNCYNQMFRRCTSLTTAPVLPATMLADNCYSAMFYECTALTTAPTLPATTLADNCYQRMFYGCSLLTNAPTLPATTLAENCYSVMFYGCESLTTVPTLPATTLSGGCYNQMFHRCTSLTTAPTLPAATLADNCYQRMFYGCTSLNSVTCLATDISATGCLTDWLSGIAASGTLYRDPSMTGWVEGTNYPSGWTLDPPML